MPSERSISDQKPNIAPEAVATAWAQYLPLFGLLLGGTIGLFLDGQGPPRYSMPFNCARRHSWHTRLGKCLQLLTLDAVWILSVSGILRSYSRSWGGCCHTYITLCPSSPQE